MKAQCGSGEGAIASAQRPELSQSKHTLPLHELHWAEVKRKASERLQASMTTQEGNRCSGVKRVMHWPESSLRFVLLEPSLKAHLNSITAIFKNAGVTITTPYRAKKDPDSCMLIEDSSTLALAVAVAQH